MSNLDSSRQGPKIQSELAVVDDRLVYPPVLTKQNFTERYARGEFGNASPTWHTLRDFLDSEADPYRTYYHLRNRTAGGETHYNLDVFQVIDLWKSWPVDEQENWYCSAMCPTYKTIIQGEVIQGSYGFDRFGGAGLELLYSRVAKPMREALAEKSERASGIIAASLLRQHLCSNSWEWLNALLENYPGHVIEFTTLSTNWGTIPGYNTLFWEVRSY